MRIARILLLWFGLMTRVVSSQGVGRGSRSQCNPAISVQWDDGRPDSPVLFYKWRAVGRPIATGFHDCDGIVVGFWIVFCDCVDVVGLWFVGDFLIGYGVRDGEK